MNNSMQKNVLGEPLEICGSDPITGYYRDGACNTDESDHGSHTVCASVTNEFLEFSKILISGGYGEIISKNLSVKNKYEPNLVLKSLGVISDSS